ncbi:MAG: class I tRNA ligase family protein [Planctomycetota bacterium]|nr:class I tRNA ligase family protein [Planctomycetota bacterium]
MTTAPAMTELPKSYVPAEHEERIRARWEDSGAFHAVPRREGDDRPPYCILIPLPNVTAPLHLGHALNNTLQDVLTRYHRMRGFNTLWMPGTDHAGIATQTVVDKRLQAAGEPSLRDYKRLEAEGKNGREQFVALVQEWKDEYEATITDQLKAFGCSCDWDRQRFTMDEMCARAVREAFFRLFKEGLIYRGKRLVNWDPATQTALADDEVENVEIKGHFWYLKYPIVDDDENDTGEFVTVATTRPETMLGDTAVAVNPSDPPRAKYIGMKVRLPIVDRIVPIIGDDYVVIPDPDSDDAKAQYATGFLKVTPAHDPNDWEIGLRHDLPVINILAPDASISRDHGWPAEEFESGRAKEAEQFLGMSREEASAAVAKWFEEHDLLEEVRDYQHTVGHSYRSHVAIEPYLSDQWYAKVTDDRLVGEAQRALCDEQFEGVRPEREDAAPQGGMGAREGGTGVPPVRPPRIVSDKLHIHRRNLPHWQLGGSTYFITFRLVQGEMTEQERRVVLEACLHWHNERMHLHLVSVMPDHVHMLLTPLEQSPGEWHSLPDILHSIKSFTAHRIQEQREASGPLWQDEYYDRIVRDDDEFYEKWNYIVENPVRAGLAGAAEEYGFTIRPGDDLGPHGRDARATDGESRIRTGGTRVTPRDEATDSHGRDGRATFDGDLRFYPPRYAKMYQSWHINLRDWCISRQLWWGHRIPVWSKYHDDFGDMSLDEFDTKILGYLREARIAGGHTTSLEELKQLRSAGIDDGVIPVSSICVRAEDDHEVIDFLEQCGYEQDPDVLDTWFSSALWPLSTMGWPEPADFPETVGLLDTFNPTSVLVTAREIITLWVSRMVMFNRFFNDGKLPYYHVYIHPMIQDQHGQRMSKSLGNGVDPRDIIHSHGADALRFTMVQMATSTQDVRLPVDTMCPHCEQVFHPKEITSPAGYRVAAPRQTCPLCGGKLVTAYGRASATAVPTDEEPAALNTSAKFDLGRNFCNKLWNATRFALSNLGRHEGTEAPRHEGERALVDRWILSRLYHTHRTVEAAVKEYQFNVYAETMYDFVWRDFCDWYLEAIKPTVREDPSQQQVLRTVLNAILRMLHPISPFVTETLWEHVRAAGEVGLEGVELPDGELLAGAAWPRVDDRLVDDAAESTFRRAQELVLSVRTLRAQHNVAPKKRIALSATPGAAELIDRAGGVVQTLCMLEKVEPLSNDRPAGAIPLAFEGDELLISGLIDEVDIEAERKRLTRLIGQKEKALGGYRNKLNNPGYVDNAPPEVVEETRSRLSEAEADLAAARKALESLDAARG